LRRSHAGIARAPLRSRRRSRHPRSRSHHLGREFIHQGAHEREHGGRQRPTTRSLGSLGLARPRDRNGCSASALVRLVRGVRMRLVATIRLAGPLKPRLRLVERGVRANRSHSMEGGGECTEPLLNTRRHTCSLHVLRDRCFFEADAILGSWSISGREASKQRTTTCHAKNKNRTPLRRSSSREPEPGSASWRARR
jgi:hypothetical protein